jgi:FlaA1/EpsC-like NDP-sugar epimerase
VSDPKWVTTAIPVSTSSTAATEEAYSIRKLNLRPTKRVLITGAKGSIGKLLNPRLLGNIVTETDISAYDKCLDVTNQDDIYQWMKSTRPSLIFHLAGAKHAPVGETDPGETFRVNVQGTANIVAAANGAKIVLASTCKACNPETVYGASKLIAERMVLNAGGVVVRYYNVRETQGNVFRLWESLPESEPIPYTDCWRYFITTRQAVDLTLLAADLPSGRYTVDPGEARHMLAEARALYPGRPLVPIPPRRGDRVREPLHADHEHLVPVADHPGVLEIINRHDLSTDTDLWAERYAA